VGTDAGASDGRWARLGDQRLARSRARYPVAGPATPARRQARRRFRPGRAAAAGRLTRAGRPRYFFSPHGQGESKSQVEVLLATPIGLRGSPNWWMRGRGGPPASAAL